MTTAIRVKLHTELDLLGFRRRKLFPGIDRPIRRSRPLLQGEDEIQHPA